METAVLSITDLHFNYGATESGGARAVLANVSLELGPGEIVCLLGPSGCGKTTLLNLVAGLLSPSSGEIRFGQGKSGSARIGYIFQSDALFPWRTVRANLMLARDLQKGTSDDEKLHEYLKTFHLDSTVLDAYPNQLSGGMRQRVSIIQALMFEPEILLLDEPFSALDFYTKLRLEEEFHTLAKKHNKSTLMVTHDIDESIAMADRIVIMSPEGTISNQLAIDFGEVQVTPEEARGTAKFSHYYNAIWSELRTSITG